MGFADKISRKFSKIWISRSAACNLITNSDRQLKWFWLFTRRRHLSHAAKGQKMHLRKQNRLSRSQTDARLAHNHDSTSNQEDRWLSVRRTILAEKVWSISDGFKAAGFRLRDFTVFYLLCNMYRNSCMTLCYSLRLYTGNSEHFSWIISQSFCHLSAAIHELEGDAWRRLHCVLSRVLLKRQEDFAELVSASARPRANTPLDLKWANCEKLYTCTRKKRGTE